MFEDFAQSVRIIRKESSPHDPIVGFAHYFPLSYLPDTFWDSMADSPSFRITDGFLTELPILVLDMNVPAKTGALWFRDDKSEDLKAYFIHFDSPTSVGFDATGPFSPAAVWSNYDDAVPLNEDPANVFFLNHTILGLTGSYSANTGNLSGCWVNSHLEQKANFFPDAKDSQVIFGNNTFNNFATEKTFFFLLKPTKVTGGVKHLFGNWRNSFPGQEPWRVVLASGPSLGILLGESGLGWTNLTQEDELNDLILNTWNLVAIRYGFGPGGIQLDMNAVARTIEESEGLVPSDTSPSTRPVGGIGTTSSDAHLSMIQTYDGDLNKGQRDVWFQNWFQPEDFWSVVMEPGEAFCFSSVMEKNICLSSHLK